MTRHIIIMAIAIIGSIGLLILGACLILFNNGSHEKLQSSATSDTSPSPTPFFSQSNLSRLQEQGLIFNNKIYNTSPPVIVASCFSGSLPDEDEYPKEYSELTGVHRVKSVVAARAAKTGSCLEVELPRSPDRILWISGAVPGNQYVLSLANTKGTMSFTYKANSKGRIFLANRPFPISAFYNYEVRLSPVCDGKTGGWAPTVTGQEVFGATQGDPLTANVYGPPGEDCRIVTVYTSDEVLMQNCDPCPGNQQVWLVCATLTDSERSKPVNGTLDLLDDKKSKLSIPK